jgi:hypothetical protein
MTKSETGKRHVLTFVSFFAIASLAALGTTPPPSTPPAPATDTPPSPEQPKVEVAPPAPDATTPPNTDKKSDVPAASSETKESTGDAKTSAPDANAKEKGTDKGSDKEKDKAALPQSANEASTENAEGAAPSTTTMPETKEVKNIDSLLVPPPLPKGKVALEGGTVRDIDQIRNKMTVELYGKGKMKVNFDERTHIFRNGVETTQLAIHKGDKVYVDTQLTQGKIFARNIQVQTNNDAASVSGQILSFNPRTGALLLRDPLTSQPVALQVTTTTVVTEQGKPATRNDLLADSLVTVHFNPVAGRPAKDIEVIARRGAQFPFYGTLTHLDLRSGLLAVDNKSDNKVYDIRFSPARISVTDDLTPGAEVAVVAIFDGHNYTAQTVKVTRTASAVKSDTPKDEK